MRVYGEKIGVAFQLLDDVIDLSAKPEDTGKVPGTDLRAGVPTMPYLLLKAEGDEASVDLAGRIDEGVARIAGGEDPSILDGPLAELRDHAVTHKTLELALAWTRDAIDALAPLPKGTVRDALTRFAETLAERSS
jgi:heptaprenyl diphosphate synthase